jgi:hypothetical protein
MARKAQGKNAKNDVRTIDPKQLAKRTSAASKFVGKVDGLFPGLRQLTPDERVHTNGRLRDGEEDAIRSILLAAAKFPHYFVPFADRDHGKDSSRFEAEPALASLERRDLLAGVAKELTALLTKIEDTRLALAADARSVSMPVYEVAKSLAEADEKFRDALAPAITFYSTAARKAQKSKKAVDDESV